RIWNQHAYSVTNINADGTIPARPATNWLQPQLNNFRANVANYRGDGASPYAAADLVISDVTVACDGYGSLVLGARVRNQGEAPVAAGVKVAFYKGNPASGGTLLGVTDVGTPLAAGESAIVTLSATTSATGTAEVWAVVDDDGTGQGSTTECIEENNTSFASGDLSCAVTPANKPPVALCRDITINANIYCLGRASVNDGSYDPDNGPSPLTITEEPYTSLGLGTHTITLTASDGEASSQCVGRITVVDNSKPTIDCPASQELETCSPAGATATFEASSADTCGPAPLSCSYASGTTFPVGDTAVTCSATDTAGNKASCGFNVTVRGDTLAPVLSCPTAPVVVTVDSCSATGSPASFEAAATDNCGPVPVSCSHASGSEFPAGDTLVTCSATDAFGNAASCEFVVSVKSSVDTSVPPTAGAEKGLELWSPNHKYVTVSLADCAEPATDACGNPLPLDHYGRILAVTSDEVEDANGNGDGRTCDDMAVTVGTTSVQLRSEREGTSDGRVYTLHYAVTNDEGVSTQSSCRVYVPHDQSGRGAVDSGVKFCVGEGCPAGTTEGSSLCNK
ncbi:MAG TPA: HYR domain-containing protein, partial [Archangium sp.]|uniref:HYR domain-containing protein n=1 Tax=Archangium sp. TaxID=1872627 RepID=UPI002EDA3BB3